MGLISRYKTPSGVTITGKDNIANYLMTTETNQNNLDIARMGYIYDYLMYQSQLAWNLDMWNKNNEWNLEQWNRQNEYNKASNQAKRLLAAGINPALAMTGSNAGTASSLSTSGPAAGGTPPKFPSVSMQAPRSENSYGDMLTFLGFATDTALQGLSNSEDLKTKQLDNRMKEVDAILYEKKAMLELNKLGEELYGKKGENLGRDIENAFNLATFDDSVNQKHYEAKKADYEAGLAFYQEGIAELEHFNLPQEQIMRLADLAAGYSLKVSQRVLSIEQAKHEMSKRVNTILNSYGYEYASPADKRRILKALIENLENNVSNYENSIFKALSTQGADLGIGILKGLLRRTPGLGKILK